MSTITYRRPRLASNYYVLFEAPDEKGDEALHLLSETRRVKLKGQSFREFMDSIIPLLDGTRTVEQILAAGAESFSPQELEAALNLLAENNLLHEGDDGRVPAAVAARLEPQLNLFHAFGSDAHRVQESIARAGVSIFGAGGAGAAAALALAAAGIGRLRLIDALPVSRADPYLSSAFLGEDVGSPRVAVLGRRVSAVAPDTVCAIHGEALDTDESVRDAASGSDFIVCCLDAGQSSLIYKLNRVCLATGTPWISAGASAMEVVVGPAVRPFETACYLCYKMRLVACAENPEDEFAFQSFLDRRKRDDSATRENLVFGAAIAGHLAALEALKTLSGIVSPSTFGKVIVLDLMSLQTTKHQVLRKPWCPACDAGRT